MAEDKLIFSEDSDTKHTSSAPSWKVLIVDDDESIHEITDLVLGGFVFQDRATTCLHAYNSAQCISMLRENPDTAVILLDVVMESDDSGLKLVQEIRQEHGMSAVRIILRTGQPGHAPERKVIENYDINDYRLKTEMTALKLQTVIMASLRAYESIDRLSKTNSRVLTLLNSWQRARDHDKLDSFMHFAYLQFAELVNYKPGDVLVLAAKGTERKNLEPVHSSGPSEQISRALSFLDDFTCKSQESVQSSISAQLAYSCVVCDSGSFWALYFEPGPNRFADVHGQVLAECRDLVHAFDVHFRIHLDTLFLRTRDSSNLEFPGAFGEFIQAVSREPGKHAQRVGAICGILARALGLSPADEEVLRLAAPLHDVGNAIVPTHILCKQGPLTDEEREKMKLHTIGGYEFFAQSERRMFKTASVIAHEHHESWDGSGYPQGKQGEEISIEARITKVADVFDALTHDCRYREALSFDKALEVMRGEMAEQFDPRVLKTFVEQFDQIKSVVEVYR